MEQVQGSDAIQERNRESASLLALPAEVLVYILSFLTSVSKELVKFRYVSRKLRSVCETPSLWRCFAWSKFNAKEERCVKNVLKGCGEHVRQFSFSHHVMPSKLIAMLKYCSNIVHLSIPTTRISIDQLGKAVDVLRNLESLDISWNHVDDVNPLLLICAGLKELTIREKRKRLMHNPSVYYYCNTSPLHSWVEKWIKKGFCPQTLNIIIVARISVTELIDQWVDYNPSSTSGYLNVYRSLKVPMDLYPALPEIQLQFGQSCTLPFVKASKCGLLGLENDLLSLTSCADGKKVLHRARMVRSSNINEGRQLKSDVYSLTFVTYFDASACQLLHPGHLEQLAIMCPNLCRLNLKGNVNCLKSLQGLRAIASYGKLQALNLLEISTKHVESRFQLWEILVDLRLVYLAIETCILLPHKEGDYVQLVGLYQRCLNLKGLEMYRAFGYYSNCTFCEGFVNERSPLSLLSNFPSLIHCITTDVQHVTLQDVLSSCSKLKCLRYTSIHSSCTLKLSQNCGTLEQLCIDSSVVNIPVSFMDKISAHGGLVHVVLCVYTVTIDGIITLIANSPKLETCHIYTLNCFIPEGDHQFNLSSCSQTLKKIFHSRKLFTCGSYYLKQGMPMFVKTQLALNQILLERNTDLTSLLPEKDK